MPIELELKIKVDDLERIRHRLQDLNAAPHRQVLEINIFFDTPNHALLKQDRGLRLRTNTDLATKASTHILTYKGPRAAGPIKKREEIEVAVDDRMHAAALLEALGYTPTLTFEKRRESWTIDQCKVELDELPLIGTFVEIEGPAESTIRAARSRLDLADLPSITDPYVALLEQRLSANHVTDRVIRFGSHE